MDEELKRKRELQMEMNRREMERKSLDTIRVYNPLDVKFIFKFDGRPFSVEAKSEKDFPRYLAAHFFKKICDRMIGEQIVKSGEELRALRERQLGKTFIDKYEENIEIWNRAPRMDDPDLIKQIRDRVILGLVEEYGYEEPEESVAEPTKPLDFRPMHDQLFNEIEKVVEKKAPVKPVKSKLAQEVTAE
jgi:hypothetical protein